ncbi:MAG: AAA-type ATPase lid domain-containing protein, partial [Planctomycetota bacterium]
MQGHDDHLTTSSTDRRVELRVLDPVLRHRIASALQQAGIDASSVEGPIELALRHSRPGGATAAGRLVEVTADERGDEQSRMFESDRIEALIELAVESGFIKRAATRIDGGSGPLLLVGESPLGAAAVVRRAGGAATRLRVRPATGLSIDELDRLVATGDTILIGNVEELPLGTQQALARRVAQGTPMATINFSTKRDLTDLVEHGSFDAEFSKALHGRVAKIDPLRRRRDDLSELTQRLLSHFGQQLERGTTPELTVDSQTALHSHHWPGGVDELVTAIERAVLLSDGRQIAVDDLPPAMQAGTTPASPFLPKDWADRQLRDVRESAASKAERAYLDAVLRHTRGVIKNAAAMCG